jgi:hypothetical protein
MSQNRRGVVISFALPQSGVTLNEPVFADFSIENALDEGVRFDLGHNRKSHIEFTIIYPDRSRSPGLRLSEEGLGRIGRLSLKPKETYRQRLLLNEWYAFPQPGKYKIEGSLSSPIETESGKAVSPTQPKPLRLQIHERNPERLRQVSETLMRKTLETWDVQEATEAAMALSQIRDPIVVPYLEKAVREGRSAWQYAIPGLARIANREAVEILISTLKGPDREAAALTELFLKSIESDIEDPELRARSEVARDSQGGH